MAAFPIGFDAIAYLGGLPVPVDEDGCWVGVSSPFEMRLQHALSVYPIDQLRLRMLHTLTETHDTVQSARVMVQVVCETELRAVLTKVANVTSDVNASKVCSRRKYIDVDADLRRHNYLVGPAVSALRSLPNLPAPYVDLVTRYLGSHYAKYRVSALAAAVCLTAAVTP
jgi:hypothetical protein